MSSPLPDAVAVVLERDGRFLLIRRADEPFAGWWSPVTGAVEPGETLTEAAVREAREETGLQVEARDEIHVCPTADGAYRLHFLRARVVGGEVRPDPGEVSEWGWFTLAEALRLEPFFPADRELYARLGRVPASGPA